MPVDVVPPLPPLPPVMSFPAPQRRPDRASARRRVPRPLALAMAFLLSGCYSGDTTMPTVPPPSGGDPAVIAQVTAATTDVTARLVPQLNDAALRGTLGREIAALQQAIAANTFDGALGAKVRLATVLQLLDAAIATPSQRVDLPDLGAIRLSMNPIVLYVTAQP